MRNQNHRSRKLFSAHSTTILSPRSGLAEKEFFHARKLNHIFYSGLHIFKNKFGSVVLREFFYPHHYAQPGAVHETNLRKVDNDFRL